MNNPLNLNVLIVEDEFDIGHLLQIYLQQINIDAYHAIDGENAIEYLEQIQPDIILLDLNLPNINGWKVLEYAKKRHSSHKFHVIVITANSDEVNRLVGKMQGITSYIQKPFQPDVIIDTVMDIMQAD